jgi:23S rRNA pseudouridine2605 synthase
MPPGAAPGPARHSIIRILSKKGLCSRKQALELVRAGRVRLNGRVVTRPGEPATLADDVEVDGQAITARRRVYVMLNKPAGCVTTRSDERGRDTVYRCLADVGAWVAPVGRLDKDSEGLLLFTNDSRFSDRLLDPRHGVPRTYLATIAGTLSNEQSLAALRGVDIGRGELSTPTSLRAVASEEAGSTYEVTLTEGRNREIRRLFEALAGAKVTRLVRTRFGPYELDDLQPGRWRLLGSGEVAAVLAAGRNAPFSEHE